MKSDIRDVTLLPRGITHNCEELEAIFTSRKELAAQFLNHRFPPSLPLLAVCILKKGKLNY